MSLKRDNLRLEELLQTRDNLPVVEINTDPGQQNENDGEENDRICLVLPKYKFTWFQNVDKWFKVLAVLLILTSIVNFAQMYRNYGTDQLVDAINKDRGKRADKWQHQFTFLGPLEKQIDEVKEKLGTCTTNAKELRTRYTALLKNFEHGDQQLANIERAIPSKTIDFKLIKKSKLEEYLCQLESNEPTSLSRDTYNNTSQFHAAVEMTRTLGNDVNWIIKVEDEVGAKLRNHSDALDSGNTDLDHLDSAICRYMTGFLYGRLAELHEPLVKVNKNYRSLVNLHTIVTTKGHSYTHRFQGLLDEYYKNLVKLHLALMQTEVCFPIHSKFDEYLMVMYGVEKHCFFKAVKPRKSALLLGLGGKDSVLMMNSRPVALVRPNGEIEHLVPYDEA